MQELFNVLRLIHIPFGLAGLVVFWVPLVLRKGSLAHRRIGWVFVGCMGVASITAAMLAAVRFAIDLNEGPVTAIGLVRPVFLGNVALLTFASVWYGIRVLRQKGRATPHYHAIDLAFPVVLLLLSIASLGLGVVTKNPLLFTLPVVGCVVSGQSLFVLLRAPRDRMFWWYEHMSGMLGGCIAAITAAVITNAQYIRPLVPAPEWVFWAAPAAIGLPMLILWRRHYRLKFNSAKPMARP